MKTCVVCNCTQQNNHNSNPDASAEKIHLLFRFLPPSLTFSRQTCNFSKIFYPSFLLTMRRAIRSAGATLSASIQNCNFTFLWERISTGLVSYCKMWPFGSNLGCSVNIVGSVGMLIGFNCSLLTSGWRGLYEFELRKCQSWEVAWLVWGALPFLMKLNSWTWTRGSQMKIQFTATSPSKEQMLAWWEHFLGS